MATPDAHAARSARSCGPFGWALGLWLASSLVGCTYDRTLDPGEIEALFSDATAHGFSMQGHMNPSGNELRREFHGDGTLVQTGMGDRNWQGRWSVRTSDQTLCIAWNTTGAPPGLSCARVVTNDRGEVWEVVEQGSHAENLPLTTIVYRSIVDRGGESRLQPVDGVTQARRWLFHSVTALLLVWVPLLGVVWWGAYAVPKAVKEWRLERQKRRAVVGGRVFDLRLLDTLEPNDLDALAAQFAAERQGWSMAIFHALRFQEPSFEAAVQRLWRAWETLDDDRLGELFEAIGGEPFLAHDYPRNDVLERERLDPALWLEATALSPRCRFLAGAQFLAGAKRDSTITEDELRIALALLRDVPAPSGDASDAPAAHRAAENYDARAREAYREALELAGSVLHSDQSS